MKPDPQEQEEKKIRKTALELKKLHRQIDNPPSIRPKEPVQRGWVRHYVLTKEARLRPDAQVLEQIIQVIGTREYHWRRNFIKGRRRRPLIEIKQTLKTVFIHEWQIRPDQYLEEWKPYFHLEYLHQWYGFRHYHQWAYVFTEKHLFELKVERHWLTHLKIIDPLLIELEAELDSWMEHHQGWPRYQRLKGRHDWWPNRNLYRKREAQAKADLRKFLSNPEEAEMKSSDGRFHFSLFPFPRVAQCRGTPLRTERLQVQVLPWGPLSSSGSPTSRGSRFKIGLVPVQIRSGADSADSISEGAFTVLCQLHDIAVWLLLTTVHFPFLFLRRYV